MSSKYHTRIISISSISLTPARQQDKAHRRQAFIDTFNDRCQAVAVENQGRLPDNVRILVDWCDDLDLMTELKQELMPQGWFLHYDAAHNQHWLTRTPFL